MNINNNIILILKAYHLSITRFYSVKCLVDNIFNTVKHVICTENSREYILQRREYHGKKKGLPWKKEGTTMEKRRDYHGKNVFYEM